MRPKRTIYSFLVLVMLIMASGCAVHPDDEFAFTPREQWLAARSSLNVVERSLLTAESTGLISEDEFMGTEPAVLSAQETLANAAEFLIENPEGGDAFDIAMLTLDGIIAALSATLEAEAGDNN